MITYTARYFFDDDGVHAEVVDYPGVISCGDDLVEARRNLGNALVDMLESGLLDGRSIPVPSPPDVTPEADLVEPIYVVTKAGGTVTTDVVAADA